MLADSEERADTRSQLTDFVAAISEDDSETSDEDVSEHELMIAVFIGPPLIAFAALHGYNLAK